MDDHVNKDAQKQKLKKYGFYALLFLLFAGAMWVIFHPSASDKEKEKQVAGFNTQIPDPKNDGMIGDKTKAYEIEALKQREEEKRKSLGDFSSLIGVENDLASPRVELSGEVDKPGLPDPIQNSASAYQDINRTLSNFYEEPQPAVNEQDILALEWRIQELEQKLEAEETKKKSTDEQLELIEKSYQLAAKYMPTTQTATAPPFSVPETVDIELEAGMKQPAKETAKNGKQAASPIKQVREQTVSALAQNISNAEFIAGFSRPRHLGFNTVDAGGGISEKNTISAVVHDNQTLINGQSVRIRLTEPMMAGNTVIPANTILTGIAALQGERLGIFISSIEQGGAIIPVEITVFDSDGQQGIYIPGSLELEAAKEIAANMGNAVGSSFTMTQSTEQQIASDLTKGAMQGVSQYMNKKIRQVKVTLKDGYKLLLLPKQE
jgi:conjugative transposon TraM protein